MISYFDTSVIMGLLDPKQEIHQKASELYSKASKKGKVATTTLHTYSELYNNLTKKGGGATRTETWSRNENA
jgi:predicted nucleic acid-binding protein